MHCTRTRNSYHGKNHVTFADTPVGIPRKLPTAEWRQSASILVGPMATSLPLLNLFTSHYPGTRGPGYPGKTLLRLVRVLRRFTNSEFIKVWAGIATA
eukprot:1176622-Rhodomonas_salina.1